jgi:hypothetical protein
MLEKNPMDQLEVARDLVRKDECEFLFKELNAISKIWENLPDEEFGNYSEAKINRLQGLEAALNILDERIGYLHDRWG